MVRSIVRTTCNRDCPDACGIVATVEDGQIVQLQGDPNHPITQGFLCYRTSHFLTRQNAGDRVVHPLLRDGDGFRRASWDEALDFIVERLEAAKALGPERIFHYQSGGSLGALMGLCGRFWRAYGPVTEKSGDICTGALDWAQEEDFGVCEANDLDDLNNARSIIIWGKNVYTSSPHALPAIKRAKKRGAKILVIDPVRNKTSRLGDFIQVKPAGDLALALAVGQLCFDRGVVDDDGGDLVR